MNIKDFKMQGSELPNLNATQLNIRNFSAQPNEMNNTAGVLGSANAHNEGVQRDEMGRATQDQMDQFQQQDQQAKQTADIANSPSGLASETGKGVMSTLGNNALKFVGSAIRSPVDIIRGLFGKDPMQGGMKDFSGNEMSSYQSDFAQKTVPDVMAGKQSPLGATANTVGGVVGGGLDVLGAEGLAEQGLKTGGKAIGDQMAKTIEKQAADRAFKASPEYAKNVAEDVEHFGLFPEDQAGKKALKAVSSTAETMTKGERLQAASEGRLTQTKLGAKEYTPTNTENRAAQILDKKLSNNPIKNIEVVKKEISSRGAEAENYLNKNAKHVTNKEHFDMFSGKRKIAEKSLTDNELKAYDEQVKMFSKQLPGRGSYDTSNYYKALKDYESNVADKLPRGKTALLDPSGMANAKLRAASDVRKVVRDMIGSKNPEFKGKMFDLTSLYDAKGNILDKADKLEGNVFTRYGKANPIKAGIASAVVTAAGGEGIKKVATGHF